MSSRILVVYYSRTGTTRRLAEQLAQALDADIEEIAEVRKRTGAWGYLRSSIEAFRRTRIDLHPPVLEPHAYDLVVIGTPIWDMNVSSPVRSYLHLHRDRFPATAFFCTCGGSGSDRVFTEMTRVIGKEPVATLVVRASEIAQDGDAVTRFIAQLAPYVQVLPPAEAVGPLATPHL